MGNSSELPEDVLDIIMKRIPCIQDFVRSSAVAKPWHSVAASLKSQKQIRFPPLLMLTNDETDAQNLRTFYCPSSKREFTIRLHDIHGRRCWGSPFGWMVTFGLDFNFHLFNPFTGVRLNLPHHSTLKHNFKIKITPESVRQFSPRRFFFSSDPSLTLSNESQPCVVIALCDPLGKLYFAKPGDRAWTAIETPLSYYEDAVYFNGQVYAVDQKGMLTVCDIHADHPKVARIETTPPRDPTKFSEVIYLAEISGELHLVVRYLEFILGDESDGRNDHYITKYFHVYKFDFQAKRWMQVLNLGDCALFVGSNTSFVISIKDYPDFKGNAIYHTDDHRCQLRKSFLDMSIYNLEEETLEPFYYSTNVVSKYARPMFIIPTL